MLVRIIRYTLDGFILAQVRFITPSFMHRHLKHLQVIFLGFVAVVKKEIHVAFSAVLIAATVLTKLL